MAIRLPKTGLGVYVLTPSFPPTAGGQENHLLELSAGLIDAGAAAGCRTILIEAGYDERAPTHPPDRPDKRIGVISIKIVPRDAVK